MSRPPAIKVRPIRVRAKLPVDAATAFAYVGDPRNDPRWVDTTPLVEQTEGDGPAIGATYRFEQTVLRRVEGTIEITELDAPNWMAFRVQDPMRDYRITYAIRERNGRAVLEQTSHPTLYLRLGWKRILVPLVTKRQLRKQMRALQRALAP